MKFVVAYAPRPHWPKWEWIADAIEARGHKLMRVHKAEELLAADAWAEVVLFEQYDCGVGRRYVRDVHQKRQAVWLQWWFDLVARDASRSLSEQLVIEQCGEVMRCMDAVLVKEQDLLDAYGRLGIHAFYMDQACPAWYPQIAHIKSPVYDVLMFGSVNRDRVKVASALASNHLSVAWATNDPLPDGVVRLPWCHPESLPALMAHAACVLSMSVRQDLDGYSSDRDWLIRGCGAVEVKLAEPESVVAAVKAIKALPAAERASLGAQARERTMNGNTYEDRIDAIVRLVEGFRCGTSLQNLRRGKDGGQQTQGADQAPALSGV